MAQEMNPDEEAREIQDRLEETRSSLSEKLETLQDRMKDTVDTTRQTVEQTMESVKQTVQDTLHSIRQTFDIKHQTQKHPWCMMGTAVFLGVFMSHLTGRSRRGEARAKSGGAAETDPVKNWTQPSQGRMNIESPAPAGPSLMQRLGSQFHDELSKLQSVAIGAGAGIFRDWVKKAMPSLAAKLEEVIDSATSKIGGEPVAGPVLRRSHNGHGDGRDD
jgi:ElaB/YqjD/DUF883 family membrane-anchored ribosome-binding protein